MDIFLSNELSVGFEHLGLTVHPNKSIFAAHLALIAETHCTRAFVNYSFVKGHSLCF